MIPELWLAFVGTVAVLALTPGPSVLLATSNTINYGMNKSTGTILGDLSANLIQIILASIGLASIISASAELFGILKWGGVFYLIFIGVKKIFFNPATFQFDTELKPKSFKALYAQGFFVSASNPKAVIFFATLFPLFIDVHESFVLQIVVLALTFLVIDGISLLVYSSFANRIKSFLQNSRKVHMQNKIVGSLQVLSGLMLSLVRRADN